MRLRDDPNAELTRIDGFDAVLFTCPADGCTILCRFVRDRPAFRLDERTFVWHASGDWPDSFSLDPSVHALNGKDGPTHWHGWVRQGVAR